MLKPAPVDADDAIWEHLKNSMPSASSTKSMLDTSIFSTAQANKPAELKPLTGLDDFKQRYGDFNQHIKDQWEDSISDAQPWWMRAFKTATMPFTAPFNETHRAAIIAMGGSGHETSFQELMLNQGNAHETPLKTYIEAIGGGLMDWYSDPLMYVSMHAGPLAKTAEEIARSSPELIKGMDVAGKALYPTDMFRQATKLTPKFIQDVSAPKMLAQNIDASYLTLRREAEEVANHGGPADVVDTLNTHAKTLMETFNGLKSPEYQAMLDGARNTIKEDPMTKLWKNPIADIDHQHPLIQNSAKKMVVPSGAYDPEVSLPDRLAAVARQQAGIEHNTWKSMPGLKLFGVPIGPRVSPLRLPLAIASRIPGMWKDTEVMREALDGMAPGEVRAPIDLDGSGIPLPTKEPSMAAGVQGPLISPPVASSDPATRFSQMLQAFFPNHAFTTKGEFLRSALGMQADSYNTGLFLGNKAKVWAQAMMRPLAPADRGKMFDYVQTMYDGVHDMLSRDPRLHIGVSADQVNETRKMLTALRDDPNFWKETLSLPYDLQPINRINYKANAFHQELKDFFHGKPTKGGVIKDASQVADMIRNTPDLGAAVKDLSLEQIHDFVADNPGDSIRQMALFNAKMAAFPEKALAGLYKNQALLNRVQRPFAHGVASRKSLMDLSESANNTALEFENLFRSTQAMFKNVSSKNGLDMLSELPSDIRQGIVGMIKDPKKGGNVISVPEFDLVADKVRQMMVDAVTTRPTVTPGRYDNLLETLKPANLSNGELHQLLTLMSDVSKDVEHHSISSQVMDRAHLKLNSYFEQNLQASKAAHSATMNDYLNDLSHWQATYHPNVLGKMLSPLQRPYMDIKRSVLHHAGIPTRLMEAMRNYDDSMASSNDNAKAMYRDLVRTSAKDILTPKLGRAPTKTEVYHFGQGVGKKAQFEPALSHGYDPTNTHHQGILDTAKVHADMGNALLDSVFKGDKGKAQAAYDEFRALMKTHLDRMYGIEFHHDMGHNYLPNYVPQLLKGPWYAREAFYKALKHDQAADMVSPLTNQRFLGTKSFGPGKMRGLHNGAEVQYWLDYYKNHLNSDVRDLVGGIKPFTHVEALAKNKALHGIVHTPLNGQAELESNIFAVMANRALLHHKGVAARTFIHELQETIPHFLLPLYKGAAKTARAMVDKKSPFVDMGEIVPSMRGWAVDKHIGDYLKSFAGGDATGLETWNVLGRALVGIAQWEKRFNTTFTLNHGKNVASEAAIAGVDLGAVWKNLKLSFQRPLEGVKSGLEHLSPMRPFVENLKSHPSYDMASRHGLFGSGRWESTSSLSDMIENEMHPTTIKGLHGNPLLSMMRRGVGPWDHIIFDIFDKSNRLALFDQYTKLGLPPRSAADSANHFMVDYSMRWMNPKLKQSGYVLAPFFGWRISNMAIHMPYMLENPRMYAGWRHLAEWINEQYDGDPHPYHTGMMAHAVITPWTESGSGNQLWSFPNVPWQPVEDLRDAIIKNAGNPGVLHDVGSYVYNSLWQGLRDGIEMMGPSYQARRLYKSTWGQWLMGDGKNPGIAQKEFWAWNHPDRMIRSLVNPDQWGQMLLRSVERVDPITPAGKPEP